MIKMENDKIQEEFDSNFQLYTIWGKYPDTPWEEIEEDVIKEDLDYLMQEYKMAFDSNWRFRIRKQK